MKSYTSLDTGLLPRLSEAVHLYRAKSQDVPGEVRTLLQRVRSIEAVVSRLTGTAIAGQRFLEIGPGQVSKYLRYFSLRNDAVGIDLDVVSDTLSLPTLLQMLRVNGPTRTAKTVVRKALGIDARFNRELARQLGVPKLPPANVIQMNAERMTFADAAYDFVFSCSTFEHLPNPGAVIDEMKRVLRPGGVAYITLHLYTSECGSHDPRIMADRRGDLPFWAHLRPQHAGKVRSNAYLNEVRLADWRRLFLEKLPGVHLLTEADTKPGIADELARLRLAGELGGFTDEELLTVEVVAVWKRP